jgi:hypothetical protein
MRTVDGAGAQKNFAFCSGAAAIISDRIVDPDRAILLEQDFEPQRPRYDGQIGSRPDRIEIAARCAPAAAGMGGSVIRSEAFLLRPVAIGRIGITGLLPCLDKSVG